MFSLFKKQTVNSSKIGEKPSKEAEKNEMEEKMEKELAIHTMPAHFRLDSAKASQAKTTGMIVMVVGVVFIIIIAFLAYLFIFKEKIQNTPISTGDELQTSENQTPPAEEETMEEILPTEILENNLPSATTTPEDVVNEEATSTPLVETGPAVDADSDGLSAKEELLLGLSDENIDTDGDSYLDFNELQNLYNPNGSGKLLDNINIGKYENKTFAYSILYPLSWARTAIGGNDSIMFRSPDNSFIQVIVQPNADKQSIEDWYIEQFGAGSINPEQKISGNNWSGIKNEDSSIVYLVDTAGNYIFVISYNSDSGDILSYKNIFAMMVKSLAIGE